jgi:anti-sigma factor RsiW
MSAHLKPEQINDLLLGIAESDATAHLGACPQCRSEMDAMRQTLASLRTASVNWSDDAAKMVLLPRNLSSRHQWARPAWAFAAAAILLVVTISFSVRRVHTNAAVAKSDAQTQIARDNQLLADIQTEIGETTPLPLQPLQVSTK